MAPNSLQEELNNIVSESHKKIIQQREEILIAFIAKYGCHPDELMLVEKRDDITGETVWFPTMKNKNLCLECNKKNIKKDMKKIMMILPDGTEHEIKSPLTLEEKITTDIFLLPKDIEALKNGYMVKFTDMENSIAIYIRAASKH